MRWKIRPVPKDSREQWHEWFAWYPITVMVDGTKERLWWEPVWRISVRHMNDPDRIPEAWPMRRWGWSHKYKVLTVVEDDECAAG